MSAICPCCGFDLATDEVIERDGIRFDPRGAIIWRGEPIHFTATQRIILHSLLKADGRCLTEEVLRERTGYQGDHNTIEVMIFRIRTRLGRPLRIQNVRGLGWHWVPTTDAGSRACVLDADGGPGGFHAATARIITEVAQ